MLGPGLERFRGGRMTSSCSSTRISRLYSTLWENRHLWLVLPGVLLAVASSAQQASSHDNPAAAQRTPIFKAETRQVLVDVVVMDHHGNFIPGLKPSDFAVLEDGKPQKIAAF